MYTESIKPCPLYISVKSNSCFIIIVPEKLI